MLALGRAVGGQLAALLAHSGGALSVGGLRAAAALSATRTFSAQPSPADLDRAAVSGGAAAAPAAPLPASPPCAVPRGLHWSFALAMHATLCCTSTTIGMLLRAGAAAGTGCRASARPAGVPRWCASFMVCLAPLPRTCRPQDVLETFRARDLVIERSTVQQAPINLEVRGLGRRLVNRVAGRWRPVGAAWAPVCGRSNNGLQASPLGWACRLRLLI